MTGKRRNDSYGTVRPDPRRRSFAMTPEALLLDKRVDDRAKTLWGILDRIAAGREQAIGSRAALAEKLNCSPSSLDRSRTLLEEAGWVGVDRVKGEASRYTMYDVPTYPQGVVIYGDTRMGVVTDDDTPSSRVENPVSSRVTTEREGTTGEKREDPPTPAPRGSHRCAEGHKSPRRGCCTIRDRQAAATRSATADRRSWPRWCGRCDGPDTRHPFDASGNLLRDDSCPDCHPSQMRRQA